MRSITEMPYIIGIKVRIYPSDRQKHVIALNAGASRFIYNRLVARDREMHDLKKVKCNCQPVSDRLSYLQSLGMKSSDLRAAYPFLDDRDIDAQTIANAIQNYRRAWKNFHEIPGTSIPAFHKKGYAQSYQTNPHYKKDASVISDGNVYLDGDKIKLPKLGFIRFKDSGRLAHIFSRMCETRIGTITIEKDECDDYYVSMQAGSVCPFHKKYRKTGSSIGIDVNIKNFCTVSDGTVIDNPKFRKDISRKLTKAQRKLSRMQVRAKKEGRSLYDSKNYQKQRLKVAELHKQAAGRREDFQHVISRHMIESQDMIAAENIKPGNLMKNHKLAFSIADCAWGGFLRKLDYKSVLYGRLFKKVIPKNTTQTCSICGYVLTGDEKLTLKDREWTCPNCGAHLDRDLNSSMNVKLRGVYAAV